MIKRAVVATVGVALLVTLGAAPAWAVFTPGPPPVGSSPNGAPSEMTMSGTGPGAAVNGFIGPPGSVSDPSVPYPAAPPSDFTSHPEGFAGIIHGTPPGGGATLQLYCIDILTLTYGGVGYNLGTWGASNVNNVGFVAYILNHYFPNVPTAPGPMDNNLRAAAVQAAIWYFSDNYVLATDDPLRPVVAGIVEDARTNGPLVQPPPPSLQITPAAATGPIGTPLGPYTVTSPQGAAVVTAAGAAMFSDAAGTIPLANGATVSNGAQIWLQQAAVGTARLLATATAIVPSGNVYLYSGNLTGVLEAQRLILAQSNSLRTTVSVAAQFVDTGALVVTKSIGGAGAGAQGEIRIAVTCNQLALADFVIPAGTTGTVTQTYDNIPTPATCTVIETVDGANPAVTVVTVNGSQTVDLAMDDIAGNPVDAVPIGDTYDTVATTTTEPTSATEPTTAPTVSPTSAPNVLPPDTLPATGGHDTPTVLAGFAVLLLGGLLVWLTRRRATP